MSAEVEKELPKGWFFCSINEMFSNDGLFVDGDWVESKDQDENGDVRLTQLADVGDGVWKNRSNRFMTSKKVTDLDCTILLKNDVLIARMPDPLGRACIFNGDAKPCVTVVDVAIVRTGINGVTPKWLMFIINSPQIRSKILSLQSGTTRKRISRKNLSKITFPLPPLNEQKRIVEKIEELFSLVDSAKKTLEKTQVLLKQYRQSILKHAFEGKLVPQDPNDEPASVLLEKIKKENTDVEYEALYEIPDNWEWVRIDKICSKINDGTHFSPQNDSNGEIPYITAKNIRPNKIDLSNITYISKKIHDGIYARCNPEKGDILYTKDGTIGYSAVNEFDFEFSLLSSVSLIKPIKNLIEPYFLSHYLNSPANYFRITGKITGTAIRRIILQRIKEIPIPLPPLNEQKRIVAKIEESFSLIEKNEILIDKLLLQYSQIKSSILKHAFEGKLVPQDPNDEPAEILLQRIREEKNGK